MEQAALLMMQRVLQAELAGHQRVFALVLGPVRTRFAGSGDPDRVTADQVGAVTVAASAAVMVGGREILLRSQVEADEALALLRDGQRAETGVPTEKAATE
jgi:3-oxoacyl-[acyl-carrier protein] reductase